MKYVVLFQRGDRTPNLDQWFDTQPDAEVRRKELQSMFDWLKEHNPKSVEPVTVWVEFANVK